MSPAFLEAFCEMWMLDSCSSWANGKHGILTSIAFRRAEISQAWPSVRAYSIVSAMFGVVGGGQGGLPSRGSWQGRIHGDWRALRHQSRKQQSLLETWSEKYSIGSRRGENHLTRG